MAIPRTYYTAGLAFVVLIAYFIGYFMHYPKYYGLPEFVSKFGFLFFLPQMLGFLLFIPLAIGQLVWGLVKGSAAGVKIIHYIFSSLIVVICQALYILAANNGFIITN